MYEALLDVSNKENEEINFANSEIDEEKIRMKKYYDEIIKNTKLNLDSLSYKEHEASIEDNSKNTMNVLLQLFEDKEITIEDVKEEQSELVKDFKNNEPEKGYKTEVSK